MGPLSKPYRIIVERDARKELRKIPEDYRVRIDTTIKSLADNPFAGKPLRGEYKGYFTLRVWPYRIIYRVEKDRVLIYVVAIGCRQGVYK